MANKLTVKTVVIPGEVSIRELYDRVSPRPDYVRVGLPDSQHEDTKLTIAQIGAIHEYGAPGANIPERPFLHPAIREGTAELGRFSQILLFQVQNGQIGKQDALVKLGLLGQRLVQEKIRHGDFTPLKPATIAAKGSSKPLIDTGQMMQSVTFAIES